MAKLFEMSEVASDEDLDTSPDDPSLIEGFVSSMLMNLPGTCVSTGKPKHTLRASGLPFCPITTFLRGGEEENFEKSFYTSTGTAIHETLQNWLSLNRIARRDIYGSWECSACGKVRLNQRCPKKLCKCSKTISVDYSLRFMPKFWKYREVELEYNGITGHVDLIVFIRPDFAIVIDLKTTALAQKKGGHFWENNKPSSLNYVTQIRTYCTLLDKLHSLPIRGWCLAVIDRNTPLAKPSDFHLIPAEWNHAKSNRWMRHLDLAISNSRHLEKLEDAIEDGDRATSRRELKAIVINRPCKSHKSYHLWMSYKFFGKEECPLYDKCCVDPTDKGVYLDIHSRVAEL